MKIQIKNSAVSAMLVVGLLLVFSITAHAQVRSLKGKVTDENGDPVVGATLKIEAVDVYRLFPGLKTDRKGEYFQILGNNQTGVYRIIVRKEGYRPALKEQLRPEIGEELVTDFQLTPGEDEKFHFEMTAAEKQDWDKRYADQQEREKQRALWSKEVTARFDNGIALYDAGNYEEALVEFSAALEGLPEKPPEIRSGPLSRMGDCFLKLDRNEEAAEAYEKAIELEPENASFYAQRGVALGRLGKITESQELFRKSAELDPKNAAMNFYNLGVTLFNSSEMDKAVDAFKQSIESDSNYAESYYMLGMSLMNDESKIPEAMASLKKYIPIGRNSEQVQIAKEIIAAFE